ncbi:unnamed protein product [Dovyalis caffra]|uniref:F-box domain-containing protein n=1 Tax=Dovyalis caffra TaxID=77055 RepID=A0AAV1QNX3_9ROSI|nr:unnamed protein product [Dovyalis caffra]
MSCCISILPEHILQSIFFKLPIATLVRCRYVCKSWRHILADPNFAKLHGRFANLLLFVDRKGLSSRLSRCRNLYFLEPEGGSIDYGKSLATVFSWSSELSSVFSVENSCKGLLCLRRNNIDGLTDGIWILNPLTGEYIILPPHEDDQIRQYFYRCGLGFCPNTNLYKVIKMFHTRHDKTMNAEVYTLGTDEWRKIGVVPQYNAPRRDNLRSFTNAPCRYNWSLTNASVNGSIHWLIMDMNGPRIRPIQMCAFDFEIEKFRSFGLPPIFQGDDYCWTEIGVVRESLCISCRNRFRLQVTEIWLMKEYGVEGSWTKMLVLDFRIDYFDSLDFRVVELLENGNVLLKRGYMTLFLYNPETKVLVKMNNGRTQIPIPAAVVSKPSFACLEDVVGDSSRVLKGFVWDH